MRKKFAFCHLCEEFVMEEVEKIFSCPGCGVNIRILDEPKNSATLRDIPIGALADDILNRQESGGDDPAAKPTRGARFVEQAAEEDEIIQDWVDWFLRIRLEGDVRECLRFCQEKIPGVEKWFRDLEAQFSNLLKIK